MVGKFESQKRLWKQIKYFVEYINNKKLYELGRAFRDLSLLMMFWKFQIALLSSQFWKLLKHLCPKITNALAFMWFPILTHLCRNHYNVCICFFSIIDPRHPPFEINVMFFFLAQPPMSRAGAMVRALTFHQCGPGSIPGFYATCGLSLLVLYSAPRGFSPGTPVFPSPQKPTFAGVAQLACARLSEQGVPSSILWSV